MSPWVSSACHWAPWIYSTFWSTGTRWVRRLPLSSGRLTVVVLEARGLRPGLAEPYVKVQLMLNQRKWKKRKTATRKGTAAPYFNEAFTFLVPFSQVQAKPGTLSSGSLQEQQRHLQRVTKP